VFETYSRTFTANFIEYNETSLISIFNCQWAPSSNYTNSYSFFPPSETKAAKKVPYWVIRVAVYGIGLSRRRGRLWRYLYFWARSMMIVSTLTWSYLFLASDSFFCMIIINLGNHDYDSYWQAVTTLNLNVHTIIRAIRVAALLSSEGYCECQWKR
jgi:hypothetical protein